MDSQTNLCFSVLGTLPLAGAVQPGQPKKESTKDIEQADQGTMKGENLDKGKNENISETFMKIIESIEAKKKEHVDPKTRNTSREIRKMAKVIHRPNLAADSIVAYLATMDRLRSMSTMKSVDDLDDPNDVDVIYLLQTGIDKLEGVFLQTASTALKTPTLEDVFGLIDQDFRHRMQSAITESDPLGIVALSLPKLKFADGTEGYGHLLKSISTWLTLHQLGELISKYVQLRSEHFTKLLDAWSQQVRSHEPTLLELFKGHSPCFYFKLVAKHVDPLILGRTSVLWTPKASSQPSFCETLRRRFSKSHAEEAITSVNTLEALHFALDVAGVLKMLQLEYYLVCASFHDDRARRQVFTDIVDDTVKRLCVQGTRMCDRQLKCMFQAQAAANQDNAQYGLPLILLPIYHYLVVAAPSFRQLPYGAENAGHIEALLASLQSTIAQGLELSKMLVGQDKARRVHANANVHPITAGVVQLLITLHKNHDLMETCWGGEYLQEELLAQTMAKQTKRNVGIANLAHYALVMLKGLMLVLKTKSNEYRDRSQRAIYYVNNIYYIFHRLYKQGVLEVIKLADDSVETMLEADFAKMFEEYGKTWEALRDLLGPYACNEENSEAEEGFTLKMLARADIKQQKSKGGKKKATKSDAKPRQPPEESSMDEKVILEEIMRDDKEELDKSSTKAVEPNMLTLGRFSTLRSRRLNAQPVFRKFRQQFLLIHKAQSALIVPFDVVRERLHAANRNAILEPYNRFHRDHHEHSADDRLLEPIDVEKLLQQFFAD